MAQLFEIKKVVVGPKNLDATVELAPSAPLMTREDLEGTTRVWEVMPQLRDHVCLGDESGTFGDVMGNTELAHLLEHVTVELLARTDIAGDISCGQTAEVGERTYKLTFKCPDDVLVVGALSSAAWLMQWAFSGGGDPKPDADAIASGLVDLVKSLPEVEEEPEDEVVPAPEQEQEQQEPAAADLCEDPQETTVAAEPAPVVAGPQEPVAEPAPVPEPEPEPVVTEPEPEARAVDEAEVEAILSAPIAPAEPAQEEAVPEPVEEPVEQTAEAPADSDPVVSPEPFEDEPTEAAVEEDVATEPADEQADDSQQEPEPANEPAPEAEPEIPAPAEPEPQPVPEPEPAEEPEDEPEAPRATGNDWGFDNVPRPHVVR